MPHPSFSHYDEHGRARMVDISDKSVTTRRAVAGGRITVQAATLETIAQGLVPKGPPFEIARIAGIAAAKKTADLIPLCHPLRLTFIDVSINPGEDGQSVTVTATASAEEKTGVEMEALVACTTALLTIYDMLKAVDKTMSISEVHLIEKSGGRSHTPAT
ncbi:MAG: cyclic pyranopterin monophosphate synthase MoaC [candidate division Zixibacteria bacterium]|nr:cyclic pyranopterin monophosphate synthase MoaC [candidate division Zixibacteria bacterium]